MAPDGSVACPGVESGAVEAEAAPGHRPRVLLLIKCLGYGGAERLLVDMAAQRDAGAFDYEAAYVLRDEDTLVPALEATGVPVHCLGARTNTDLRWLVALRRLLVSGRFDIVHLHLPYAAALGRPVVATLPRHRRPLVLYTEHSMWGKIALPVRALNRLTIRLDKAVVAVSRSSREALPPSVRRRARVVVHGVDLTQATALRARCDEMRASVRSELGVPAGDVLVLAVANLRAEKGYDVLLEATRLLMQRGAPVRVVAVGRGPLEQQLRADHAAMGLGERFAFVGPRRDVLRLMAGADCFVLASHFEGLPVALMEATASALAIVASAVGEIPEILSDGTDALLVPPGRPDALADALARVVADGDLRCRLARSALARSALFDVAQASRAIEDIYRELLAGAR